MTLKTLWEIIEEILTFKKLKADRLLSLPKNHPIRNISIGLRTRFKRDDPNHISNKIENRIKTSIRMIGENNIAKRPEVKDKLRVLSTGRLHTEETKLKMSVNHFKICSENHKKNLGLVSLGSHWYHDPITKIHRKFNNDIVPINFTKGRIYAHILKK